EQQRVHDGGYLGVLDRLLALEAGDELPVLVDLEIICLEPRHGLVALLDREEDPHVVGLLLFRVDARHRESAAAAGRSGQAAECGDEVKEGGRKEMHRGPPGGPRPPAGEATGPAGWGPPLNASSLGKPPTVPDMPTLRSPGRCGERPRALVV